MSLPPRGKNSPVQADLSAVQKHACLIASDMIHLLCQEHHTFILVHLPYSSYRFRGQNGKKNRASLNKMREEGEKSQRTEPVQSRCQLSSSVCLFLLPCTGVCSALLVGSATKESFVKTSRTKQGCCMHMRKVPGEPYQLLMGVVPVPSLESFAPY